MKVKVIGAGPCGSVATISALRAGYEVEVFEEHEKAGYPSHCSGLVSKEGLDSLLDFINYRPHIINKINTASFDFSDEIFEIKRKEETAYLINRAEFDNALAQKAEEEGAKFFYGKKYAHKAQIHKTKNSEYETIIGADGALSATAYHFKFPKIEKFVFTLKTKVKINNGEKHKVSLFYDNKSFPGFFGWLIPHNEEEAEIGMGTLKPELMKKGFDALIKKTKTKPIVNPSGKIIPIEPRKKTVGVFGKTNVLLVGDAAGHVKSSSGGGIVFGTSGARFAGLFAYAPYQYELAWKRENKNDILVHKFLQNFFALQPNFSLKFMARISKILGFDYLLSRYGNMDRPTKMFARCDFASIFNLDLKTKNPYLNFFTKI